MSYFLSSVFPPWRWPYDWAKHVGCYCIWKQLLYYIFCWYYYFIYTHLFLFKIEDSNSISSKLIL